MSPPNLRHLRLFAAVAEQRKLTAVAQSWPISQPAITQALGKLERNCGAPLFERTRHGFFPTRAGRILQARVDSAFALLDPALEDIAPRLKTTLSHAQLQALIAVGEAENFTLAARRLGLAQPTVHRAVTQVEQEAGRDLFERTAFGILPTRLCQALVQAGRLALYELAQAEAELAELAGGSAGSVVVGAMPLARASLLPRALGRFRRIYPTCAVTILDGPYDELLRGLRRGAIDFLVGALRDPAPIGDILQQPLFDDPLALLCSPGHPLARRKTITAAELAAYPWVVPGRGTPARAQFEALFTTAQTPSPTRLIESGSLLLMRELLAESDHLGCISRLQAQRECDYGLLTALAYPTAHLRRPIGITRRRNWRPTAPQQRLLGLIGEVPVGEDGAQTAAQGRTAAVLTEK